MILKESEKAELLHSFPTNIELSYETTVHKKVYDFDYVMAIPEGNKFFAWFYVFRGQNVCLLLEVIDNKQINDIEIVSCSFKDNLCYGSGTVLYGTIFKKQGLRFFAVEDSFYNSGTFVHNQNYFKKYYYLYTMFATEIKQVAYSQNSVVFGLPLIKMSLNDILKLCCKDGNEPDYDYLPYKVKSLNFIKNKNNSSNEIKVIPFHKIHQVLTTENNAKRENSSTNIHSTTKTNTNNNFTTGKNVVLKVKPDIQNDIYHLYTYDDHYIGIAYISNYNCSVMMNKLFRNIKENLNLDALEESDDEEDFQDDRIDKYVFLEKEYNMVCFYNYKFKKWEPLKVANQGTKVICKRDLCI
jgi:hypothetical protein